MAITAVPAELDGRTCNYSEPATGGRLTVLRGVGPGAETGCGEGWEANRGTPTYPCGNVATPFQRHVRPHQYLLAV